MVARSDAGEGDDADEDGVEVAAVACFLKSASNVHGVVRSRQKAMPMPAPIFDRRRVTTIAAAVASLAILVTFGVLSNWMQRRRRSRTRESTCVEQRRDVATRLIRSAQNAIASGAQAARKQTLLVTAAVHFQHALSALSAAQSVDPENASGIDIASMYQDCRARRDDVLRRISRLSGNKFRTTGASGANDTNDSRTGAPVAPRPAPGRV